MRDLVVTFLTRPGCHLCDSARPVIIAEVRRAKAKVEEIDVDTDDRLLALYGMRIPVVLDPNGEVIAEGIIKSGRDLRKRLKQI